MHRSYIDLSDILFGCEKSLSLRERFFIKVPISVFTEVRPVGSALTDRRTDMTKVRSAFRQAQTPCQCKGYTTLQFSCTLLAESVVGSQIAICTLGSKVIPLQAQCGPESG